MVYYSVEILTVVVMVVMVVITMVRLVLWWVGMLVVILTGVMITVGRR